jgi:hypothetical protein
MSFRAERMGATRLRRARPRSRGILMGRRTKEDSSTAPARVPFGQDCASALASLGMTIAPAWSGSKLRTTETGCDKAQNH